MCVATDALRKLRFQANFHSRAGVDNRGTPPCAPEATPCFRGLEVDPVSGVEAPFLDDSPLMNGTQIRLGAGMARFLIMSVAEPRGAM